MKKVYVQAYIDDGGTAVPSGSATVDSSGELLNIPLVTSPNVGAYRLQAFNADDGNWFILDGRALSRTTYSALFSRIGTTFGAGDGSTTFNIPPSPAGRAIGCAGAGAGLTSRTIGDFIGTETHTLTIAEMPSHTHTFTNTYSVQMSSDAFNQNLSSTDEISRTETTNATGGGGAHNNMQPTAFLGYMAICVK